MSSQGTQQSTSTQPTPATTTSSGAAAQPIASPQSTPSGTYSTLPQAGHPLVMQHQAMAAGHDQPNPVGRTRKRALVGFMVIVGIIAIAAIVLMKQGQKQLSKQQAPIVVINEKGQPVKTTIVDENSTTTTLSTISYAAFAIYVIVSMVEFILPQTSEIHNAAHRIGIVAFMVIAGLTVAGIVTGTTTVALIGGIVTVVGAIRYLSGFDFSPEGFKKLTERIKIPEGVKEYGEGLDTAYDVEKEVHDAQTQDQNESK